VAPYSHIEKKLQAFVYGLRTWWDCNKFNDIIKLLF
jgi:hypothetical protein